MVRGRCADVRGRARNMRGRARRMRGRAQCSASAYMDVRGVVYGLARTCAVGCKRLYSSGIALKYTLSVLLDGLLNASLEDNLALIYVLFLIHYSCFHVILSCIHINIMTSSVACSQPI